MQVVAVCDYMPTGRFQVMPCFKDRALEKSLAAIALRVGRKKGKR
jgi:hypothetical protein